MAYSKDFGKNAAQGGPFPEGPKGNMKRPQNYIGKYVVDDPKKSVVRKGDPAGSAPASLPEPDINDTMKDWA